MIVQYINDSNERITKTFLPPRDYQDLDKWWRQARKAIPSIPDVPDGTWRFQSEDPEITTKYVKWILENPDGKKQYVVVDRVQNFAS